MPGRLQDKIAIMTGAAGGIGRATALAYHAEGAKLVCADLREVGPLHSNETEAETPVHDIINQRGGHAVFHRTDITQPAEVEALVQRAIEWGGRLDVMFNNAGISFESKDPRPVWDIPTETWEKTNRVNSDGVFYGTKFAAKQMMAQEPHASGDRGWIINTASILGLVGSEHGAAYCASKGAVVNFTRAAALDCGPLRIHVNCVCPGYTASAMTLPLFSNPESKGKLLDRHGFGERLGKPEDLAAACVFLASPDARWVSGVALPVDGGYTAK